MTKDQLREAIRAVIRKQLAEVQPAVAPTKPSPEPPIVTGKQIGRASCRERVCQYV